MNEQLDRSSRDTYFLFGIAALAVLGQVVGPRLFDNCWAFLHWQLSPLWYPIVWILATAGLLAFSNQITTGLERVAQLKRSGIVAAFGLFVLFVLFQIDSIIGGGGNLRVAQIAQAEIVIHRYFEFGTSLVVSALYYLIDLVGVEGQRAGMYAWKALAWICSALSILAAVNIARELSPQRIGRLLLFLILFLGPQTVLYFGFAGVEPVVVAFTLWFALLALRIEREFTTNRLLAVWLLVIVAVIFHYTLLFLLPGAIFLTIQGRRRKRSNAALGVSLAGLLALVVGCYLGATSNLEFSSFVLFLGGKNPHGDYGLFSPRHLGDYAQFLFVAFPQLILMLYWMIFRRKSSDQFGTTTRLLMLLSVSGMTISFILDPVSSIVLDSPRLTAYLTPLAILLGLMVARSKGTESTENRRPVARLAIVAVMVPLMFLPTYLRITNIDAHAADYFEKHHPFYRTGCLAFRDAYFLTGDYSSADRWEWQLPKKSSETLIMNGVEVMIAEGHLAESTGELYRMLVQFPYWAKPKALLADLLIKQRQFDRAKKLIDECLQLEPYNKGHLSLLYTWYRDKQDYQSALKTLDLALELFPDNTELLIDKMIVFYRVGDRSKADSLANHLIDTDATIAYPYFIRGLILEGAGNLTGAISDYQSFIKLNPEEADLYNLQEKIDSISVRVGIQ